MRLVEVFRRPTQAVREFAVGRLSDHLWLDLDAGGAPGFIGVTVVAPDTGISAYAQISAAPGGFELEALGAQSTERLDAVETALDALAVDGGGHVTWWVDDAEPATLAVASAAGLAPHRALHEMRRPLPHEQRATVITRPFHPGIDDSAWLEVNNRAFADHAEQGGWTPEILASRLDADWFDADGFRLYEIDGELAAFCWTKVHPATATDPELGEIYVIAVDPAFHGRGLGKQLTLAGLDWLSDHGVATADLYVDAANTAAVGLYERLGFAVHRTRTAFAGTVAPAEPPTRSHEEP